MNYIVGKLFLIFLFVLVGVGCGTWEKVKKTYTDQISFEMPEGHRVKVAQEHWIKPTLGEAKQVPAGTVTEVKDKPVLIEKPGHVGVLILPPGITPAEVDLNLRPMPTWAGEATKRFADRLISELLLDIHEVQLMLGQGKTSEALAKAQQLRIANPGISYLKFLEASCYLVQGQPNRAKELLKSGLADHPDDESAKNLYRSLAGEKAPE